MQINLQSVIGQLPASEADVVIITASDQGELVVHPQWECDVSADDLPALAARLALGDAEYFGHGPFYAVFVDRRGSI